VIVLDLGCYPHGHEISIERLIERYMPDVLYGFDPYPALREGVTYQTIERHGAGHHTVTVNLRCKAAWTFDGEIEMALVAGARAWDSTVMRDKNSRREWDEGEIVSVPCFDLAAFVSDLPRGDLIVKMDIEGAEFPLLDHLVVSGADALVDLCLVEWHDEKMGYRRELRDELRGRLHCPLEEWAL
jgi:FkbM family methyltransferase